MKFIIATTVLCLCLVLGQAQTLTTPEQWSTQLSSLVDDMTQIGIDAGKTLVHQYEEIVVEPQQQLEQAVDKVETRRKESPECVAAQDAEIVRIVDTALDELHVCGVTAAHDSADIVSDVNAATQQLVFGGYSRRARSSVETIKQATNERIPGVFVESKACTHLASSKAIDALDVVITNIDSCIARARRH
ncbi:uncharacterized protein LOC132788285 [Drosophila nasuta]|uniref:uncharacterized protein LOC132788285 n=1 Tax=Drosophila nasuta TaxID=42062 RepID=UPI00295EF484|nr:uncharacterized protein LOC132788285 [Drosophila nasuta]